MTILAQLPWLVLFQDIRFTFGSLRAAQATGLPVTEIFVHRPLMNRLLMATLDSLTGGQVIARERITMVLAILGAAAACIGLDCALRRWITCASAFAVGLASFGALAWAPGMNVLQPEWTAALLSVAGVALALSRRQSARWFDPTLLASSAFLALATLQKYTTLTVAAVALGVVAVVDRGRAWIAACWTVGATGVLFLLSLVVSGPEWQWFREMPRLNETGSTRWDALGHSLWNLAWVNPAVALLPAAVVLGLALSRRSMWLMGTASALAVIVGGVIVQNAFIAYQYGALPVLSAALVALAAVQWWERTARLPLGIVGVSTIWILWATLLGRESYRWRLDHFSVALSGMLVTAGVALSVTCWEVLRQRHRAAIATPVRAPLVRVLLLTGLVLTITFPAWPTTPYGFNSLNMTRSSEVDRRAAAAAEGKRIRAASGGSTVSYLTSSEPVYFAALPTHCAYPTATFIYRSVRLPTAGLQSFKDNLACLSDSSASYLVLQPSMAPRGRIDQAVTRAVIINFDCERPVLKTKSLLLCPRRDARG